MIADFDQHLLFNPQPDLAKSDDQSILINFLKKTGSEFVLNLIGFANNRLRKLFFNKFGHLLCVCVRHPLVSVRV